MILGKTKNKKMRKRNRTTRRKKKKGGEYSKIAKLLLKKKRSQILENTANDTIKHSDIRTDKHPKRQINIGNKSPLKSNEMWKDYKDKTLETNIKNLSLFGDKHEVEYNPVDLYMDSVSRGGKRKKSKKGKKRKTRGKRKTHGKMKTRGKRKTRGKMKKGGDAPCNFRLNPNEYCRQKAFSGSIENNENTMCNMDTGVCIKPPPLIDLTGN